MESLRNAWADVDLDAIADNAGALTRLFAPAELCAVVKADGYGHGAVPAALAALRGGATRLAVALVEEGRVLRNAGIDAPILVLSEPQPSAMAEVVANRLVPAIYTFEGLSAAADAVAERGGPPLEVHVKVDTGMNRVGIHPKDALELVRAVNETPGLHLEGLFTHFAVSDEPMNPFTAEQASRFAQVVDELDAAGLRPPILHCANSAAGLLQPNLRMSFVRAGAALYGISPSDDVPLARGTRPAMSVVARTSLVKFVEAGERLSYGQRYEVTTLSTVATVPVGYADGLPRALSAQGGEVLIHGVRRPMAGTITMDQFMVDCGDDASVHVGDEVVIMGRQGDEEITANEIAGKLGTVAYEVVCRIGPRLPRRYFSSQAPEKNAD